jgi:polyphosphate kinase 2 (PPK2 family)
MLTNSGTVLFKFWFSVREKEQAKRFKSRETDPLKQWKLSPIDIASRSKWDEYTEAREAMLKYTNTASNPWTLIKSDDKQRARVNCMRYFLNKLDYPDKDKKIVKLPDPLIVGQPPQIELVD